MIGTPLRCVQGAPITVTFTPVDADGEPSAGDPGIVTVGVVRADGTAVVDPGTATTTVGVTRTFTLTATHTANLDRLVVTWTAAAVIGRTAVDIVGAVYLSTAEIRDLVPSLSNEQTNPAADLIRARHEVEGMVERACGHVLSFVPRFSVATVNHWGNASLRLPHYFVRRVRWLKYGSSDGTLLDFDPVALALVGADESGMVGINSGTWPTGRLLVGYEHGTDAPDAEMRRAAALAIRRQVNQSRSGVDPRAISHSIPGGEIQRFPTPGLGPWTTGVPEIDEVLAWWRSHYPALSVA